MSQISLFFLEFFIFLVAIVSIPIFFYDIAKTLIDNISNCFLIFDQEKIKDIAFFIEEKKYKYLLGYFLLYQFFNCIVFISFLTIWFILANKGSGIYLSIPFIIVFLLISLWLFFLLRKYWRKINKIGFQSKKVALVNFERFQNEWKSEKINFFTLFENDKIALRNFPFQFQQKKYQKKNFKLNQKFNNKKISQEKYQMKLLLFFTKYLKVYARFLIWMKNENEKKNKKTIIMIEDQKYEDVINILNKVLINNFFAFVEQAKKRI